MTNYFKHSVTAIKFFFEFSRIEKEMRENKSSNCSRKSWETLAQKNIVKVSNQSGTKGGSCGDVTMNHNTGWHQP